jgi:ribosomal protein S18 acetylase RimI-like enzyme
VKVKIRAALVDDYEPLLPLFDQIDSTHRENLPDVFVRPLGKTREKDYFVDLLSNSDVGFFVAEMDDRVVGFVHGLVREMSQIPIFRQRRIASIDSVVVTNEFQRKGIGSKLVETVQAWAIENGAESIELNVYEFNESAIAFYHRMGFLDFSRKMRLKFFQDVEKAG